MPLRNRVTPLGELVAVTDRGLVYGNRGCLHDGRGEVRRHHATRRWIACRLRFRGWHRSPLLQPGKFTELFFLDEATAFAAGHRPCALCRREDYVRFNEIWIGLHPGERGADTIDSRLHDERLDGRAQRRHEAPFRDLPDGTMVLNGAEPQLVRSAALRPWSPGGYGAPRPLPSGTATVITPPSLVEVLRAGWSGVVPLLHPTAF
jgi:hypothetical protein